MFKAGQGEDQEVFKRWVMTAFEDDFSTRQEPRKKAVSPNDIDFAAPVVKEVPIAKILPDLVVDKGLPNHVKEEDGVVIEDVSPHEVEESLLQSKIIRGEASALAPKAELSDLGSEDLPKEETPLSLEENSEQELLKEENSAHQTEEAIEEESPVQVKDAEVLNEPRENEVSQEVVIEDIGQIGDPVKIETPVLADDTVQIEDVPVEPVVSKKAEPRAIVSQATIEDVHELISSLKKEAKDTGYREGIEQGLIEGQKEGIKKGFEEGLKKGLEEGRNQGYQEAFDKSYQEESEKASHYIETLKQLTGSFQSDLQKAHERIANDILALSIDLAKAMVKEALHLKPEVIVPIVKDAIDAIPSLERPAKLCLNKEDIAIVQKALGSELQGWQLVEAEMERGSCKIETSTNQVDNQLETRWKRLMAHLGQTTGWVE